MTARCAGLMAAMILALASGCSRGKAVGKAVPSTKPSTVASEEKPPAAPPVDPEPAPGEAVRLTLSQDAGTWPWPVGKVEEAGPSRPVSFPGIAPFTITGLAVRPDANRAVASFKVEKKGQPISTRFVLCDLAAGKALTEWQVPGQQAAIDLSPDGRSILSTNAQPGRDRAVLRMWIIGSDGQLRRVAWTAHTARPDGIRQEIGERSDSPEALEIRWAGFVGNDRIASVSRGGQVRVFDSEGGKPLYSLEGTPGRPAVTPDGTKIAIFTGNAVTLLDPMAGKVIGTRWIGPLPSHPVLAFHPEGGRLAIGGNGKALILDLASGDLREAILPRLHVTDTGMYDKPFGWAGRYLFCDAALHDVNYSAPVWEYPGAEQLQFQGGRIWVCCRPWSGTTVNLAAFALPHASAVLRLAAASGREGARALAPGDAIRIDVNGVPDDKRAEAQSALEQRLRALGYRPDPAAAAVLYASVDATGTKAAAAYSGLDSFTYTRKPAQLRLVINGKDVWSESWAVEPPLTIRLAPGVSLAQHFKEVPFGGPNYGLFVNAPLPFSVPGPQAPTGPAGASDFHPERLKGWLGW